jgi:methylmalonyl-CoA/ethylmalonyl-CoA epimerase
MDDRRSPLVQRLDHVGVVVRDISVSAPWWTARLGLELVHVADVLDGSVRLAYLDAGDTTVQLVQPLRPGTLADWLEANGEGLHHVCFLANGALDEALDALDDRGSRHIYLGGRGAHVGFLSDAPCGVFIELTEPTAADWRAGGSEPVVVVETVQRRAS